MTYNDVITTLLPPLQKETTPTYSQPINKTGKFVECSKNNMDKENRVKYIKKSSKDSGQSLNERSIHA